MIYVVIYIYYKLGNQAINTAFGILFLILIRITKSN